MGAGVFSLREVRGTDAARYFEGKLHGSSISLIVVDMEAGKGPRLHRHPYDETFIVLQGRATFSVGDEEIEVEAGNVVVVPKDTPHRFVSSGDVPLKQLSVQPCEEFKNTWLEPSL